MRMMTPPQLAKETGLPVGAIRAACKRKVKTLPHVECGEKRPHVYIDYERFCKWISERNQL